MIRCVPRKTFLKPYRTIALGTSATIGSARISRSSAVPMSRPAVLSPWRMAPAQAGSPVERPGRMVASGPADARVEQRLHLPSKRDGLLDALDGFVAERDVEGLGLVRVRANERAETARRPHRLRSGPRSRPCRR